MSNCPCPTVNVPGPEGPAVTPPTNGTNGLNAFSAIDGGGFVIPAYGASVTIALRAPEGSLWIGLDQTVFLGIYGFYSVTGIPDDTHITIENLGYPGNVNGNGLLTFADGSKVSPGGLEGPSGSIPGGVLLAANNLNDLTNVPTARTSLGLGTAALNATADFLQKANNLSDLTNTANARTSLGLGTSATHGTGDFCQTANNLSDVVAATARTNLGLVIGANVQAYVPGIKARRGLLGNVTVNLNGAIADQNVPVNFTRAIIRQIILENASVNLGATLARFGIYTGSGKTGTTIVTDPFAPTALTASSKFVDVTLAAGAGTDVVIPDLANARIYFYLSAAHGVAATANLWIFGDDLS